MEEELCLWTTSCVIYWMTTTWMEGGKYTEHNGLEKSCLVTKASLYVIAAVKLLKVYSYFVDNVCCCKSTTTEKTEKEVYAVCLWELRFVRTVVWGRNREMKERDEVREKDCLCAARMVGRVSCFPPAYSTTSWCPVGQRHTSHAHTHTYRHFYHYAVYH